jgi:hypothetical protein
LNSKFGIYSIDNAKTRLVNINFVIYDLYKSRPSQPTPPSSLSSIYEIRENENYSLPSLFRKKLKKFFV